jgi:DNA-binding transcriptional regulator YiaG
MTPADLKTRREQLGLSQAGFARVLGVSVRSLQNWEQGHRGIPRFTADGIERALTRLERRTNASKTE